MKKPYAVIDKTTNTVNNIIILDEIDTTSFVEENHYLIEATPSTTLGTEYDPSTNKFVGIEESDEIFYLNEEIEKLINDGRSIYMQESVPLKVDAEDLVKFYEYDFQLSEILNEQDLNTKKTKFKNLVKPDYSIIENALNSVSLEPVGTEPVGIAST